MPTSPKKDRRPNFYARIMDKKRQEALRRARDLQGLEDDLALARSEVYAAALKPNPDRRLILYGLRTVAAIHSIRDRRAGPSEATLYEAVRRSLTLFDNGAT